MKKHLNDPSINRKYNYLYRITNKINGKIYIGVHRTDNVNDGNMGSGVILKRAKEKYGVVNFRKEILEFFDTYQEALDKEREVVSVKFIESSNNYNIREGGYGNCKWSTEALEILSESAKKRWASREYRDTMQEKVYNNPDRNLKVSKGVNKWIKDNPDKHYERMLKINHNPEKIKRMAEAHTGMKRSDIARKNISEGIKNYHKNNIEESKRISGKGCIYINNPSTGEAKRIRKFEQIPSGWVRGTGKRK